MNLAELFPDADYRFALRFTRGDAAAFFAPTEAHAVLRRHRAHWLQAEPATYAALEPEGVPLLHEARELAHQWTGRKLLAGASPWRACLALGEFWEPDFLLLKLEDDGEIRLRGGCLCFPSAWRLGDKLGQPLASIHAPVPGLNADLGAGIHKFLANLKPGLASLRHNWGLARTPELNQHPDRNLPRLDAGVAAAEVWLRVEHQALVALPAARGILFGIRIVHHPLAEVRADVAACAGLRRALTMMPEALAVYKGIAPARERLLELLRD